MNKNIVKLLLVAAVWIWQPAVSAAPQEGVYVAEVPVDRQSEAERDAALEQALAEVLVRVTGEPAIADDPQAQQVISRARELAQQFGYREEQPEEEGAEPELFLEARFDGPSVDRALRAAGLPVWGAERPETLIWLAIDEDGDRRILGASESRDRAAAMRRVASNRGIPIEFPAQDAGERQRIDAADIFQGHDERVRSVSRSYGPDHLLTGRAYGSGGDWRVDWVLSHDGDRLGSWENRGSALDQVLADAMRRVADIYASRYAIYAGGTGASVAVAFDRVGGARDYARISNYLAGLSAVKSVVPVSVESESAVFRVDLSGDESVLRRGIGLADWLTQDDQAQELARAHADTGSALGYRLVTY